MLYIERDITEQLAQATTPVQILIGPRQCGKSTLLSHLGENAFTEITFDDLQMRNLANQDPALFFAQFKLPLLLDEVQYVPNLFPEIKQFVDQLKKARLKNNNPLTVMLRLTGSNQLLMDKHIKESLAGRASYFYLNTLSVHEIQSSHPKTNIADILFQGGWPELYIDPNLSPIQYLNDYVRSYIEKDIVLTAGIQKQSAFHSVLNLLAARTGMLLDYSSIANISGVQAVTVKEWVGVLERTGLLYCLKPYSTNLNKRLTKTPKCYFLDTGLAVRLQGWQERLPLLTSPQAGHLFETLVFAELYKFINNTGKDWRLYLWRTKEGEEIDFIIAMPDGSVVVIDAKMSMQKTHPISLPPRFKKLFPKTKHIFLVTFGGRKMQLSDECVSVPISELYNFLNTL